MEIKYIAEITIVLIFIITVTATIFFLGNRADTVDSQADSFIKYGNIFGKRTELCEKYDNLTIDKQDLRVILAVMPVNEDCREMSVYFDFSITDDEFEQLVLDIFPKERSPKVIYKTDCEPYKVKTGSYVVSSGMGEYLFRKGDKVDFMTSGDNTVDVMVCLDI